MTHMQIRRNNILCIIGLSFYWPLFKKSWIDPLWSQTTDNVGDIWATYYLFVIATVIIVVGALLVTRYSAKKFKHFKADVLVLSLVLLAVSCVLCFASLPVGIEQGLLAFDACVRAAVFVGLTMLWGSAVYSHDMRMVLVEAFASLAISSLLMFASMLPVSLGLIVPIVCPAVSACMLLGVPTENMSSVPFSKGWRLLPWSLIGVLALSICIVALLYGIVPIDDSFYPNATWTIIRVTTLFVAALIVSITYRCTHSEMLLNMIWLTLTVVLILALFFALITSLNLMGVSKGLILASQSCLNVFLWCVLVVACRKQNISPSLPLALLYAGLLAVSGCVANALGPLLAHGITASIESYLVAATALLTLVLVLSSMLFLGKNTLRSYDEALSRVVSEVALDETDLSRALEERYDLSTRESDVALLLSRGYSVQRIADALFISTHTVQSHMKSIYRKMAVHKKQDLIDLVEGIRLGRKA